MPTEAEQTWSAALASVIAGRKPAEVAPVVAVGEETVRRWLRGDTVPSATVWRKLAVEAKLDDQWAALSAARDAVERKPTGRRRLSDEEVAERAGLRALGRRKVRE